MKKPGISPIPRSDAMDLTSEARQQADTPDRVPDCLLIQLGCSTVLILRKSTVRPRGFTMP